MAVIREGNTFYKRTSPSERHLSMDNMRKAYEEAYCSIVNNIDPADLGSEDTLAAARVLKIVSESPPPSIALDPTPDPNTVSGKIKHGVAVVWESETTRTIVKAAGAFAGVWLVVRTTIKQDAVLEKQALDQARQANR